MLIVFAIAFAVAQELPRASERVAVAAVAGLAQALGFLALVRAMRESGRP
jgi:hypothetical protein